MTSQIVTQEMIDAYYECTHLNPDRRKFAKKLRQMIEPNQPPKTPFVPANWSEAPTRGEARLSQ